MKKLIMLMCLLPFMVFGTTWFVDAVNGNDSYNGILPKRPFKTLTHAINVSEANDQIVVEPGQYTGPFKIHHPLTIAANSNDPSDTILSGNETGVIFINYLNYYYTHSTWTINHPYTKIQGFTITGGKYGFEGTYGNQDVNGGGIFISSNTAICDCIITNNSASRYGGGISVKDGDLILYNSVVACNTAPNYSAIEIAAVPQGTFTCILSTIFGNQTWGYSGGNTTEISFYNSINLADFMPSGVSSKLVNVSASYIKDASDFNISNMLVHNWRRNESDNSNIETMKIESLGNLVFNGYSFTGFECDYDDGKLNTFNSIYNYFIKYDKIDEIVYSTEEISNFYYRIRGNFLGTSYIIPRNNSTSITNESKLIKTIHNGSLKPDENTMLLGYSKNRIEKLSLIDFSEFNDETNNTPGVSIICITNIINKIISCNITNVIEVYNVSNVINIIDKYVTNTTEVVHIVTNTVISNVSKTNIVSVSSAEYIDESNVARDEIKPVEGIDISVRKTYTGIAYDENGYAAGIAYVIAYPKSRTGLRAYGTLYLNDGKSHSISSSYGTEVEGKYAEFKTKTSAIGASEFKIYQNGISGKFGNYTVEPVVLDEDIGLAKGSVSVRYVDSNGKLKTKTLVVRGMIIDGAMLIDIYDKKSKKQMYGEILK